MKSPKEIAQWVIDNRYPKSENDKVSDFEMYHEIVKAIENLLPEPLIEKNCSSCKHEECSSYVDPCYRCNNYEYYIRKN
jgi:hypothetical protein